MIRVILIVLGVPVTFLLVVQVALTFHQSGGSPSVESAPGRHRGYESVTQAAWQRYQALSPDERRRFRADLAARMQDLSSWLASVPLRNSVLCLGESHDDYSRRFIAARFLPALRPDLLALEVGHAELADILSRLGAGKAANLLGADIGAVLEAARRGGTAPRLLAMEPDPDTDDGGPRESALRRNFLSAYRQGEFAVVLIGALHCLSDGDWFLGRLRAEWAGTNAVLGVRVVAEGADGALQSTLDFLDQVEDTPAGLSKAVFVLQRRAGQDWLADWFPLLNQQLLSRYDAVVVFRRDWRTQVPP